MGAIFNTDDTVKILKFLNKHYEPGRPFQKARTDQENLTLRNEPGDAFKCAKKLGLHDSTLDARWQKWLDFLDLYEQDTEFGGTLVRNMMAKAIEDPNCNGIEFFAVPAPQFKVHTPAPQVTDKADPTKYTVEIIVETNTIDQLVHFYKERKRRRRK